MAVITKTVAGIGEVTVTGDKPFKIGAVRGGFAGAFKIHDANDVDAQLKVPSSPDGNMTFANTKRAIDMANAIVAAVNV